MPRPDGGKLSGLHALRCQSKQRGCVLALRKQPLSRHARLPGGRGWLGIPNDSFSQERCPVDQV